MIHLIQTINDFSVQWATIMFRAAWQGAIVLAVAWIVCRALPGIPARMRCWIWRAAYFKLLLGLIWATPINLALLPAKSTAVASETAPIHFAAEAKPSTGDISKSAVIVPQAIVGHPIDKPRAEGSPAVAKSRELSITTMLMLSWLAGVAVGCAQLANEWRAARRLRRSARPIVDPQLTERLARLAERMGLRRPPRILGSSDGPGPLLAGQFRPAVIPAVALLETCDMVKIEIAAAHELAHLRRHDLQWCWLPRISRILFFFHPLVLFTQRDWRAAQESACDEAAIASTGIAPSAYGQALLHIISRSSFPRPPVLALAIADSRKNLERRLLAMKQFTSTLRHPRIAGIALGCAIVAGIVPFHVTAQTPTQPKGGTLPADSSVQAAFTQPADATNEQFAEQDGTMARFLQDKQLLEKSLNEHRANPFTNDESIAALEERLTVLRGDIEKERQMMLKMYVWQTDPNRAERELIRQPLPMSGVVSAMHAKVSSPVIGVIREVTCANGQRVKKGDVLVQLDDTEAVALLEIARSNVAQAQLEHARLQQMEKQHVTGVSEVDSAANALQKNQSLLKIAEHQVLMTRIVAPIDGVVIRNKAIAGETTQIGEELAIVFNADRLLFRANISAASARLLKTGQKVIAGKHCEGIITFISPQMQSDVNVEASIDNKNGSLADGESVELRDAGTPAN